MNAGSPAAPAEGAQRPLADLVRQVYLARASGAIRVPGVDEAPSVLRFRDGELYVTASSTPRLATLLSSSDEVTAVTEAVVELGRRYPPTAQGIFAAESSPPSGLLGPAPAVWLAIELAVHGRSDAELIERLGGGEVRLRAATGRSPALGQLSRLDEEMARALPLLGERPALGGVSDGSRGRADEILRGLTKLHAAGLAEPVPIATTGGFDQRSTGRLAERIAESLRASPLELDPEEHRQWLAALLSRLSELDHYALLELAHDADAAVLTAAYDRLARLAHPSHAVHLGLVGRDEPLRVVFERATEAYLTLSDPQQRLAYNRMIGLQVGVAIDRGQREEEKRTLARRLFRRAGSALEEQDFGTAVDLLSEACRLDPRAEYWASLGRAQGKNPNWSERSLASLERAVALAPEDAGMSVLLGQQLEKLGRLPEARQQYERAARLDPGQPLAARGLERLAGVAVGEAADAPRGARRRGLLGFLRGSS